jgi:hypothetical protein
VIFLKLSWFRITFACVRLPYVDPEFCRELFTFLSSSEFAGRRDKYVPAGRTPPGHRITIDFAENH